MDYTRQHDMIPDSNFVTEGGIQQCLGASVAL